MKKYIFIVITEKIKTVDSLVRDSYISTHFNLINKSCNYKLSTSELIEGIPDPNKLSIIFYEKSSGANQQQFDDMKSSIYFKDCGYLFAFYGAYLPSFFDFTEGIQHDKLLIWLKSYNRRYILQTQLLNK